MHKLQLLLIGHGKMGGAMLAGWQTADLLGETYVIDPAIDAIKTNGSVHYVDGREHVPANFTPNILLLAIKPQLLDKVLPDYIGMIQEFKPVLLSILAGKTIADLAQYGGEGTAIIRSMPNLPATIGQGMTALIGNNHVTKEQQNQTQTLLEANGEVLWIDHEDQLDAITAISGSGPAYLFHFLESYINAAKKLGFNDEQAQHLVYQTVRGSMELAQSSTQSAAELRQAVTSKNGTTEAALNKLMPHLQPLMEQTLNGAYERSKEL